MEYQPRKQLRVDLSVDTYNQLERFTVEHGMPRRDLVRQAIAVYIRVLEAKARGETLAVVDANQNVLYQILLT